MYNIDISFYDRIKDVLDIGDKVGDTDYIDFLTHDEVPKNIMKGIDYYNRKFITIKCGWYNMKDMKFHRTSQVFFQRYTNDLHWQSASFEGSFILTSGGISKEQYQLINDLVDGKLLKLEEHHRPAGMKQNCIIASMDYWENYFAIKIQKQWIKCRYSPEYTVCKRILNKQFDEYISGMN